MKTSTKYQRDLNNVVVFVGDRSVENPIADLIVIERSDFRFS
jgi:hypothetical protein